MRKSWLLNFRKWRGDRSRWMTRSSRSHSRQAKASCRSRTLSMAGASRRRAVPRGWKKSAPPNEGAAATGRQSPSRVSRGREASCVRRRSIAELMSEASLSPMSRHVALSLSKATSRWNTLQTSSSVRLAAELDESGAPSTRPSHTWDVAPWPR